MLHRDIPGNLMRPERMHATAVALNGAAVLLVGAPGAGKSDLALRLIEAGALLVADDQVELIADNGCVMASPPQPLRGLLEVRGLGILRMPYAASAPVVLLVDLEAVPDRMPSAQTRQICGIDMPCIALAPFEASAPAKLARAVALARASALWSADDAG